MPDTVVITHDQAVQIISLSELVRLGSLTIIGPHRADASAALADIAEECALQLRGATQ